MKLKWEESGLKSDMARARGLGSARNGMHHWLNQRITAFANVFLVGWLLFFSLQIIQSGGGYDEAIRMIAHGINPILMILVVVSIFYHAALGLQVVIEDYIHHEGIKTLSLVVLKLLLLAMAVACIFSTLKVTL
jgi:succinate dehydrogenase / fumarate reductase, membrane anchor subunit